MKHSLLIGSGINSLSPSIRILRLFILMVVCMGSFPASPARAANGSFAWAKSVGGTLADIAHHIEVDAGGNLYLTGSFSGTVDFDPGPGTVNLTSGGAEDLFIVKLDRDGNFLWARNIGGLDPEVSHSLAVDASGNVYTTGYFFGIADFDPGSTAFALTSAGGADIFILKLDSDGNFVWVRSLRGTLDESANHIEVDSAGSVYTTGLFTGTVDFDPGVSTFNLTSVGFLDIFVSKLDSSGNFVWAGSMGGAGFDEGKSLTLDAAGNVYITGSFEGTADFAPGPNIVSRTSAGNLDIFVVKLDSNGDFVRVRSMGGASSDQGTSLAIDPAGNVYTTGYFQGTADFDPGAGTANLASAGDRDVFISRLDSNGGFVWARGMGGTSFDEGWGLALDASGNVFTAGVFSNTADFDPGPGTHNLTSAGEGDVFVSKLSNSGEFVWARGMGGAGYDQGASLALDTASNVYTTGDFYGAADFDPGAGTFNLTSAGASDVFLLKLQEGDSFELDNSPAQAKDIASGVPQTHNLVPAADVDWVKFTLSAASAVTLETSGTTAADTEMSLFTSSDLVNPYGYNNDKDAAAGNRYSYLTYNCFVDALPAGTYYVKVNEYQSDSEIPEYQLSLSVTGCATTATFNDVPMDYWAWSFIERLYAAGITGGCATSPLRYCPEETVTRAQMAVFLLRGIHTSAYTPPAVGSTTGFGDVPTDYWAGAFIKQLAAEGITSGCGSGNYCPEQAVTRAQMAVFLLRSKYGASYTPPAVGSTTGFGDVPPDYWAAAFVKQLVTEGITAGCGSGNYCPEQPVTRAQMAVFLVRTFSLP